MCGVLVPKDDDALSKAIYKSAGRRGCSVYVPDSCSRTAAFGDIPIDNCMSMKESHIKVPIVLEILIYIYVTCL